MRALAHAAGTSCSRRCRVTGGPGPANTAASRNCDAARRPEELDEGGDQTPATSAMDLALARGGRARLLSRAHRLSLRAEGSVAGDGDVEAVAVADPRTRPPAVVQV